MIYYTGAIQHLAIQTDPSKSLGGYISSSQVPNDVLSNIFGTLDYTTIINKLKDTRVLAFLNTTGSIIDNFSVYTITPQGSFAKLKVGLVNNEIDAKCNIPYFEQLPTTNSTPLYVTLNDAEGAANAIQISNIQPGEYVGIFLQREVIVENNSELNPDGTVKIKSCDDFYSDLSQNPNGMPDEANLKDEIEIIIQF